MNALPPGSTIGIFGGGQLGRMLSIACAELGYHAHIYCPDKDCPAEEVANTCTHASYHNTEALTTFAASVDAVTLEFENIPLIAVETAAMHTRMYPSQQVLSICQHRLREKDFLRSLGIETAPYHAVNNEAELHAALATIGTPSILKTTELGYDGKGQVKLTSASEAHDAWHQLFPPLRAPAKQSSSPLAEAWIASATPRNDGIAILEGFVPFVMEASVIVARSSSGETAVYPPVQNIHKNHILHQTIVPAPLSRMAHERAEGIARHIAEKLELVGILAVEMFITEDESILVNELAPRPHNSGHWTLDACTTSQFEQTIRAVCGLPLSSTHPLCPAVMTNLIGDDIAHWQQYLSEPNAKLHLYGKTEARQGRKMGHVTKLLINGH